MAENYFKSYSDNTGSSKKSSSFFKGYRDNVREEDDNERQRKAEESRAKEEAKKRTENGNKGLKNGANFVAAANEALLGGLLKGAVNAVNYVGSGFNAQEADKRTGEFLRTTRQTNNQGQFNMAARPGIDRESGAFKAGTVTGDVLRTGAELGAIALPGVAVEKGLRGTRLVQALAEGNKAGRITSKVAPTVVGGTASSAVAQATNPDQSAAQNFGTGFGIDLATSLAPGVVRALKPGVSKLTSALDESTKGVRESAKNSKTSGKIDNFFTQTKQKLIDNTAVVQRALKDVVDENGVPATERIRELSGNVRQADGLAVSRRENNPAWQELRTLYSDQGKRKGRQQLKSDAEFINAKQTAINAQKAGTADIPIPKGTPEQEKAYSLLNQATKDDVQYAFDNGLLSKEKYDTFMADTDYVRIQRDLGDELGVPRGSGSAEASISSTTLGQKLKGSTKKAVDPFAAYTDWSTSITKEVERNKFATYVTDQLFKQKAADFAEVGDQNTLARFKDGVKELVKTDPQIVDSIKNMDKITLGGLQKFVMAPARLLQAGATGLNTAFAVPNFIRDQVSSLVVSKNAGATHNPLAFYEGLKEAVAKPTARAVLRGVGARKASETYFQPSAEFQEFISRNRNMTTADLVRDLKSATRSAYEELGVKGEGFLRKLENFNTATEKASRYQNFIGTYRNTLKKGADPEEALRQAQQAARENSVDFSQKGELAVFFKIANPYFNAAVQGSRTLGRALKERPVATSAKIGATILTPVAVSTYYNLSDPERAAIYAQIPEYERNSNIIMVLGGDRGYIKLPLTPGIKEFADPLRNLIESEYLGDRKGLLETAKSLIVDPFSPIPTDTPEQFVGSMIPQALRPAVENVANFSFYRGDNVVPEYLKGEEVQDQAFKNTPQLYKDIGAVLGASPLQVQNIIRGYGAGGAEQLVAALDAARGQGNMDKTTIGQIVGRFYKENPEGGGAVKNQFYEEYTPLSDRKSSVSSKVTAAIKNNDVSTARKLASDFNNKVADAERRYKTGYGVFNYDSALLEQLNKLKIDLTDKSITSRRKQKD